jgi:hypothetical protein
MNAEMRLKIEELLKNIKTENDREEISKEIARMTSNINVSNRNRDKTEKFAEKIIKKENEKKDVFVKFLESKSVNGVIFAPTQVGKSAATGAFIETCFKYNTPVIVSTDNKTDQQEQLYYRIEKELAGAEVTMLKVTDNKFDENLRKCIKEKIKRFVIFCLDNASQIEKLIIQLSSNYTRYSEMKEIKRIAIIHDEADTITKDQNTESQSETQATSHRKWLELRDLVNKNMGMIDLKRVFVTATPENCCMLYNIECPDVMTLEIPSCYTGYKDIEHVGFEDDLNIKKLLRKEIERIKEEETYEAILYCIDRKIANGHDRVLKSLADDFKCIVNTYNGNGITTFIRTNSLGKKLEHELKKYEISFTAKDKYYQIKNISIRKFYTIVKKIGERCVITIGKDLICRGISYVGENQKDPITATTMFYKPGNTMHAVGICQTIGRITGCAMPDLHRRLYAPKDVYDTYINYNKNQEVYIKNIEKGNEDMITKDIIEELVFNKYTRNIDRMKLNLRMNMRVPSSSEEVEYGSSDEDSEDSEDEETIIDGVNLKKLRNWIDSNLLVGKMINYLYEYEEKMSFDELKEGVEYYESDEKFRNNIKSGGSDKSQYGRLWITKNNQISLNKNIRKYIDNQYN